LNVSKDTIDRISQREAYGDKETMLAYIKKTYNLEAFQRSRLDHVVLTSKEIAKYFLRLNDSPDIVFCEDVTVRVKTTKDQFCNRSMRCLF